MKSKMDNFNQAVADARRDYPEETKNTTFIPVTLFRGRRQIKKWFKESSGITDKKELRKAVAEHRQRAKLGIFYKSLITDKSILSINYKGPSALFIWRKGLGRKSLLSSFRHNFNHELGHAVTTDVLPYFATIKLLENMADAFALLRGFQQGTLDKTAVDKLYEERRRRANSKFSDDSHEFVDIAANKVRAELKDIRPDQLTPQKIKKIAQNII